MSNDKVFFEWKNKTNELIEENTTILLDDERITPLEYLIQNIIEKLENE